MPIQSLAARTDMIFHRQGGVVTPRDNYLVVRTPDNPGYYFGNYLLVRGDGPWEERFRREFGDEPRVRHVCIVWDEPAGAGALTAPFGARGFNVDENLVLAATAVHMPARANAEAVVRPLTTDEDWETATQIQIDMRDPKHGLEGYTTYKRAQMRFYRALARKGLGNWWGAFLDGRQAANLGLFWDGAGVGRFQQVVTAKAAQRQGLCARLVHDAAQAALAGGDARQLVMVADEHYHAARIYQSVGFRPVEKQGAVYRA
jgi:GNAT superfamily N-acetyltransferase